MSLRDAQDWDLDLASDAMRRFGYRVIDAIVEHAATLRTQPAVNIGSRDQLEALLREGAPEDGKPLLELLAEFETKVAPWKSHIDHPRSFAWVPGSGTFVGAMADALASGYNIYAGTWVEGSGVSQLELIVIDWFRSWLGMPAGAGGTLLSGGSVANLTALVLAREVALGGPNEGGVIYASELAHSSVGRGAFVAGFRTRQIRTVPIDETLRIDVGALRRAIDEDRAAGRSPFCLVASAGATTTGTIDPLSELADLCAAERLWLHVDAAYGGFAVLDERGKRALSGIERADSVTLDPHKWLYMPYECGCLMVRDFERLGDVFRVMPDYLVEAIGGSEHPNFCDYGIQLTRSTRALKVWMTLKAFGLRRMRAVIGKTMDLARHGASLVRATPELEVVTPTSLSIFTFRFVPERISDESAIEALNKLIVRRLWDDGRVLISSGRVGGRYVIRFCVTNHHTTKADVEETIALIARLGRAAAGSQGTPFPPSFGDR